MNQFGYQPDVKIIDKINQSQFTLSAEIIPPRNGAEQAIVLDQINSLVQNQAQFLSVTKGAGGSLRGGSLPIAQTVKERFHVPCVAHFTCRDLVPAEVENQLMDHHYFGIRNILALRGDPPNDQKDWVPKSGSHEYAYQLIEQLQNLNQGTYLKREGGRQLDHQQEATDFCIGAAVYPEHPDQKERVEFFKQKVSAGAEYGITQMVFDVDKYSEFLELCDKNNMAVPILPGTRILKSRKQAERMSKLFQVSVPENTIKALPEVYEKEKHGDYVVDHFLTFVEKLKRAGAPGVHLFVLSDTKLSCLALRTLAKQ